eukprot:SAG31_NODE_41159_length_277_cov_0.870787_1_plen_49_part_01
MTRSNSTAPNFPKELGGLATGDQRRKRKVQQSIEPLETEEIEDNDSVMH